MQWGNLEVEKTYTHLIIRILKGGKRREVSKTFLLSTNGKGLRDVPNTRKIIGRGLSGPLLLAETVSRDVHKERNTARR